MRKKLSIVFMLLLFIGMAAPLISQNKTFACSCASPGVEKRYEDASAVFAGTVKSRDQDGGNIFDVEKIWKGELPDGYVYSGFFGMCGTEFEAGRKYLVYAFESKGTATTGLCSGNKLISEASRDIQILDRIARSESWNGKHWTITISAAVIFIIMIWVIRMRIVGFRKS